MPPGSAAARLVEWQSGKSRAYLYRAHSAFLPVIHLWAAFILPDRRCHADKARGCTAIDDLQMFIVEAMALLQWAAGFKLDRKKADPTLNPQTVDFWVPPADWSPSVARLGWPRDGRLQAVSLEEKWVRRTRSRPPQKKPV